MDLLSTVVDTLVGALVGAGLTHHFWVRQKLMEIRGAYDQELRTRRLTAYQGLWCAFEPLAMFFPEKDVCYADVVSIGPKMRSWYFTMGGLVLTHRARELYFLFQETLDRVEEEASRPQDVLRAKSQRLTQDHVNAKLKMLGFDVGAPPLKPEAWKRWLAHLRAILQQRPFGNDAPGDFIVLQSLASRLRTLLTVEIKTREPSVLDASDDTGLSRAART
jgi:hypothetical protein